MSETFDCGHGCKITCPDGGGCIYNEDTHQCSTFCNDTQGILKAAAGADPKFAIQGDSKVTIHFKDVTPSAVAELLRNLGVA
jgi:hypothetical protein